MAHSRPSDRRLPVRLLLIWALAAGAGSVSCQEPAWAGSSDGSEPHVIGLLLPPGTPGSEAILAGIHAAVDAANEDGGRPVRLAVRGRKGAWGTDADAAARLICEDRAEALIGPPDAASSHLLMQVARKARRPIVMLSSASTVVGTGLRGSVARVVPGIREEAVRVFRALAGDPAPGGTTWGLIVPAGRDGSACARDLAAAGAEAGGATQVLFRVADEPPGIEAVARRLRESDCSAIFLALPAEVAGQLARVIRKAGYDGILAGPGHLLSARFASAAGPALEGFMLAAPAAAIAPGSPVARAGDLTERMAGDAVRILVDHLRRQATDPQAFPRRDHPAGLTGPLVFDARGSRVIALSLLVMRGGRAACASPAPESAAADGQGDGRNM